METDHSPFSIARNKGRRNLMADIKTRKVDRTSIKKIDRSIAASHRIRDASSEIKQAGKAGEQNCGDSVDEYTAEKLQEGIQRGRFAAGRAAAKTGAVSVKTAQKAMRQRAIKEKNRKQIYSAPADLNPGENAVPGSGLAAKRRQKIKAKEKVQAAEKSRQAMMNSYRRNGKFIRRTENITRRAAGAAVSSARSLMAGARALIAALTVGGGIAIAVVTCCVIFGAAFYFFGDDSTEGYVPVSPEVEAYSPVIQKYCREYGIPQFAELVKAVMMQESGGKGTDPMQASECKYNTEYPKKSNGIKNPEYSISCGVRYLKDNLDTAKARSPVDMYRIKLALQGYNYGSGYIPWAVSKYGGYSYAGAVEFSEEQAEKNGWKSYGDPDYVEHVLRYYPYGNYSYDVINTGPGKLGLPIQGMKRGNISSHFGPRSSPGGFGSTYHQGLDIAFPTGTKVLACEAGTVISAGYMGGLGNCIVIDHGNNLQTVYGHLSEIKVKEGQKVVRGQYIGNVGSTGNSTGPHLHLGVKVNGRYVNPEKGWLSIP